jgi:hypothetical protein
MNHERSSPAYLFYCKESIMIVNASYNPLIYASTPVSYGQAEGGNTLPGSTTKAASSTDQVTISSAGKALATNEATYGLDETPPRTESQQRLIDEGNSDPLFADEMSNMMPESVTSSAIAVPPH